MCVMSIEEFIVWAETGKERERERKRPRRGWKVHVGLAKWRFLSLKSVLGRFHSLFSADGERKSVHLPHERYHLLDSSMHLVGLIRHGEL